MADKRVIVIGAGIAGLSAGCYAQMNGYQTDIFEMHNLPGGLCTAWKRGGYTFDGCIHWLVGSRPDSSLRRLWDELGALRGTTVLDRDEFLRIEGPDGQTLILYSNVDRLEQHLKELSPADAVQIEDLTAAIRMLGQLDLPLDGPAELPDDPAQLPPEIRAIVETFMKYSTLSGKEWAAQLESPFLRSAFERLFQFPGASMIFIVMTLGYYNVRNAGYPIGGSLPFSRAIERRYLDLGGQIHYQSPVETILVEDDRAVGVRLADGSEQRADVVISAADGRTTIFDMLEGRYTSAEITHAYEKWPIFQPLIQVSLGVGMDLASEPESLTLMLPKPTRIAGKVRETLGITNYAADSTLAPHGKSVVVSLIQSTYAYWADLAVDRARYDAEKQAVADWVIAQLDRRFPGFAGAVEVVDVATPLTFERYTGNWQGSYEGWVPVGGEDGPRFDKGLPKTLPGLKNFYMVGQWVEPGGGLPPAALSGRTAIRMLCAADGRPFETSLP